MQLAKVYLIHERSNEEDTTTGAAEYVFRRERVWNGVRVKTWSLVGDANGKRIGGSFERRFDCLVGVVRVAVKNGVDGCFADGHRDVADGVFVEAGSNSAKLSGLFNLVDGLERRIESEADTACG